MDLVENTSLDENALNQTATLDLNNENTTTNEDTRSLTSSARKPHESDFKFQFNNASGNVNPVPTPSHDLEGLDNTNMVCDLANGVCMPHPSEHEGQMMMTEPQPDEIH